MSNDNKTTGLPYTDPSSAVKYALDRFDFNAAVVDAGPVELRIIADFTATGCAIHHMGVSHVQPPAPPRAKPAGATFALRALADAAKVPSSTFLLSASAPQMADLSPVFDVLDEDSTRNLINVVVAARERDRFVLAKQLTAEPKTMRAIEVLLTLLDATP